MTALERERVLTAARRGRISFYERDSHHETEFDISTGEPVTIAYEHGVCAGCVYDAAAGREHERCAREDPFVRCASVAEVEAWIGGTG